VYLKDIRSKEDPPLDLPEHWDQSKDGMKMQVIHVSKNKFVNELMAHIRVFENEILKSQTASFTNEVIKFDLHRWKNYFIFLTSRVNHEIMEENRKNE